MQVEEDGKIISATVEELRCKYLKEDYYKTMSLKQFMLLCKAQGIEVINEKQEQA